MHSVQNRIEFTKKKFSLHYLEGKIGLEYIDSSGKLSDLC